MPKIEIEFATAGEASIVKAWAAARKAQDDATVGLRAAYQESLKLDGGLKGLADEGKKAFGEIGSQLSSLSSQMTGLNLPAFSGGLGVGAAATGFGALNYYIQEQQHKEARQEAARVATLPVADAVRDVKNNLVADDFMNASNVESKMQEISRQTRSGMGVVAAGLTPALSAEGSLGHKEATDALKTSLMLKPNDVATAGALPGRLLDLANIQKDLGEAIDIPMLGGLLSSTQGAARVQDLTKLGQTYAPFAQSAGLTGDNLQQSAALFAGMTTVMKDAMGDKTSTAMISLANQLKSLPGEIGAMKADDLTKSGLTSESIGKLADAKSTTERIAAIQQSPDLQKWLFAPGKEQLSFEQAAKLPMQKLLSGDDGVVKQMDAARGKIVYGDAARAAYDQKVKDLESGRFQSPLTSDQASKQAIEENKLAKSFNQRAAAAKQILDETLETVEGGSAGKWIMKQREWWHRQEDRPEAAAAEQLAIAHDIMRKKRNAASSAHERETRSADLNFIETQIGNLNRSAAQGGDQALANEIRDLLQALRENTEATRGNTKTVGTSGDREPAPGPPPTATLAN